MGALASSPPLHPPAPAAALSYPCTVVPDTSPPRPPSGAVLVPRLAATPVGPSACPSVGWACALPWPAPRTPAPLASPPSLLRARIFSPRRPRAPCPSRVHCVLPVVAHGPCLRCPTATRTASCMGIRAVPACISGRALRVWLCRSGPACRARAPVPCPRCHRPCRPHMRVVCAVGTPTPPMRAPTNLPSLWPSPRILPAPPLRSRSAPGAT